MSPSGNMNLFVAFFVFMTLQLYSQSSDTNTPSIISIADLKAEIQASSFMPLIPEMQEWFPNVVSSTHWQTEISQHFLINYYIDVHDEDDILFDSLLYNSENIYNQLIQFFEIQAQSKQDFISQQSRLICFIIKTRTNTTFGFLPEPQTFFFYLDSKQTPDYMEKFRHEYAHWVWGRSYGEAPSFIWEGLATYAEKMSIPNPDISNLMNQRFEIEIIPPLKDCFINEVFWKQKGMYTAGSLFVYYLVENWGWDKLKQLFLISDFEDQDIHGHFYQVYGLKLVEMDHDWKAFLRTRFEKSLHTL